MKRTSKLTLTLSLAAAVLVCGCGGTRWEIVQKAPNNPMAGAHEFYVAPVQFDGIIIQGKSEAEWLATRNPKQQAAWTNDKAEYTRLLLHQLSGDGYAAIAKGRSYRPLEAALPERAFVVAVRFAEMNTDHLFVVTIKDAANHVIDEVRFPMPNAGSSMTAIGFAPQFMNSRSLLAERLDRYLRDRSAEQPGGNESARASPEM